MNENKSLNSSRILLVAFSWFLLLLCLVTTTSTSLPAITPRECLMCKFSVSLINYALRTQKGAEQVRNFANSFCNIAHIESPLVCSNITRLFNHEIIKVLSNALITPNQVCGYISNNTCGHYNDPLGDWEVNLDASMSLNQEELDRLRLVHRKEQQERHNNQPLPSYRVLHISDTHIDLKYSEGSVVNCGEPLCCRKNSSEPPPILGQKADIIQAGIWGSYGSCDVPLKTFENVLSVLNSTIEKYGNIEYIIWTGDIQPHDVWQQDRETAMNTYDQVFKKIIQYLPSVKIFPTLGNHEMVPVDSFSPSNLISIARDDSPEWLYRKLDSFWSRWLPIETINTITKDGFYATTIKPGLKLVSLNTNFCHNKNFWLYINATDPGSQLQWLIHELQISELQHEQVHIIGHIPPGVGDCLKVWSRNYNKIVRRFAKTIAGQFFGHTHNNEFEIFYDQLDNFTEKNLTNTTTAPTNQNFNDPQAISVAFIGPSVTTFIDLNPSFRVYTVDPNQEYSPVEFETYFMNLTAANLAEPTKEPTWHSVSVTEDLSIPNILPETLHKLILDIISELEAEHQTDKTQDNQSTLNNILLNTTSSSTQQDISKSKIYKLYRMFHNYSDKFNIERFKKWTKEQKKAFLCKFLSSRSHDTQSCKQLISDRVLFDYISVV